MGESITIQTGRLLQSKKKAQCRNGHHHHQHKVPQFHAKRVLQQLPGGSASWTQTRRKPFLSGALHSEEWVSIRDKVARNINTFTPSLAGGNDIHAYLQDIDFHLGMLDQATHKALIQEFADLESEQSITVMMDVKQGRQGAPRAYGNCLRKAYFGS